MTVLNSCCFWHSMRKGSYVSGIYTLIYFGISSITISLFLYDEKGYLMGEVDGPKEMSFIGNTKTTVIFNLMLLICAALGVVSSIFLLIGLTIDCRHLLMPWILTMVGDAFVEATHFFYVIAFGQVEFKVLTAFIFTVDFFVVLLNVYCLLCVVSQYQEYKQGRGLRKASFVSINDLGYMPSTEIGTSPNIANFSKTSSMMCGHTNCNLPAGDNSCMKHIDEIVPWNEQNLYD